MTNDNDFPPRSAYDDLAALVEVADMADLVLRPPAGSNKWSADLMEPSPTRPPVGVQGKILDADAAGAIDIRQARRLLDAVQERITGRPGGGLGIVDADGTITRKEW